MKNKISAKKSDGTLKLKFPKNRNDRQSWTGRPFQIPGRPSQKPSRPVQNSYRKNPERIYSVCRGLKCTIERYCRARVHSSVHTSEGVWEGTQRSRTGIPGI